MVDGVMRALDANSNRVSEGLRVLEDMARFRLNHAGLLGDLRRLRHRVRAVFTALGPEMLSERDVQRDVGVDVSRQERPERRASLSGLAAANFKRVQEGLRVLEENLKVAGQFELAASCEGFRFESYRLEKVMQERITVGKRRQALNTDIYGITSEEHSLGRSNLEVVGEMLKAGIKIIQYREKDKEMRQKYEECLAIRDLTSREGAAFIINDHVDLALLVGADGVHLGQDDLPPKQVRELVGEGMLIGLSTHSPEQARDAMGNDVDYLGVGPVFATQTKKDVCAPVGLSYVKYAARNMSLPFVAIGGIKEQNIVEVARAGARCVAMVTEIVGAPDIVQKVRDIRGALREEGEKGK